MVRNFKDSLSFLASFSYVSSFNQYQNLFKQAPFSMDPVHFFYGSTWFILNRTCSIFGMVMSSLTYAVFQMLIHFLISSRDTFYRMNDRRNEFVSCEQRCILTSKVLCYTLSRHLKKLNLLQCFINCWFMKIIFPVGINHSCGNWIVQFINICMVDHTTDNFCL